MVEVVTGCLLEILYVGLDLFFCSKRLTKMVPMAFQRMKAFQGSGSNFLWRSGDFISSEFYRKPIFLVDGIIELCINVQEILEFVVAVLSPNKKLISSVFIYGKPVKGTLMTFCF